MGETGTQTNTGKKVFLGVGILFTLLGIGFFVGMIIGVNAHNKHYENAVAINAAISRIETYEDSDGDTNHSVYVTYTADGEEYSDIPLNYYSSGMREGSAIEILYLPDNPTDISTKGFIKILTIILTAMGVTFSGLGIILIVAGIKSKSILQPADFPGGGTAVGETVDFGEDSYYSTSNFDETSGNGDDYHL